MSKMYEMCVKCHGKDINVKYYASSSYRKYHECRNRDEHLHKTCRNCGYEWCDPTKDQE